MSLNETPRRLRSVRPATQAEQIIDMCVAYAGADIIPPALIDSLLEQGLQVIAGEASQGSTVHRLARALEGLAARR